MTTISRPDYGLRHALRTLAGAALTAAVTLSAVPTEASAGPQERAQQQRDEAAQELREALEAAAADPAAIASERAPTPAEETEIGPGGKRMAATEAPAPPRIDGQVDDDVWRLAEVVTDFLQREPVEAGVPSQRTEVRILFDDDYLYLGFVMYDDEPGRIVATDLRRDSRLETDDTIAVLLDTFHDHRNGFLFRVNALGTKYDATLQGERNLNSQWDEKWEAAARVTPKGWEAEMQIPFKALRFDAGAHVWGIDFKREIRRTNEEVNWSNYRRGFDFRNISQGGHLLGLRSLKLSGRYRLKPYATGAYTALDASGSPFTEGTGDFGIEDFKVQISPNLTADLTVNTDFAQVEDDQERVNLTRFPLFFPERREFFLEGSDKFAFGSGGERGHGGSDTLLYHSRNIGLFDGTPVTMRYGAKLTGKMGNTSIGFINAQTGSNAELGYIGRNHSTLRLKQDILERSSVGVILTNVQGGGAHNRVGGVDASFRFFDHMSVRGYVAQARDSQVGTTKYVGAFDAGWDSDLWSAQASYAYVDPDFVTDMGFIRRHDMIRQAYRLGWKPRPSWSWMRQMMVFTNVEYTTDTAGNLETRENTLWTRYQLESGDSASIMVQRSFERIRTPFEVSDQAEIGVGDYSTNEWRVSFETYRARRLSGRVNTSGGGFFDGTRRSYGGSLTMRFNEKLSLSPRYDFNHIQLPADAFDTHVASMRASYNFSERWLTSALVQYNSIADRLSIFARLNFIHRTGHDLFLVYKSTVRYDPEFYGLMDQALIAKMTRSFDF